MPFHRSSSGQYRNGRFSSPFSKNEFITKPEPELNTMKDLYLKSIERFKNSPLLDDRNKLQIAISEKNQEKIEEGFDESDLN